MNRRLALVLLLLAAAGVLVWQLASRGGRPAERAEPARGAPVTDEKAPALPPAPDSVPAPDGAKPDQTPAKAQGIRVRVVAEGKPVLDAQVHATAGDTLHEFVHEGEGAYYAGATGAVTIGVTHARFGPARRELKAPEGAITEVTLELPAGETLDVAVVSDRGEAPVAGASVFVLRAGGPALEGPNSGLENSFGDLEDEGEVDFALFGSLDLTDLMQLGGLPATAIPKLRTDANGRARLAGLPKGTVDVVVSHPDFVATRLRGQPTGGESVARLSSGGSLTVLAPYVDGRAAEGYLCGAARPGLMLSMPIGSATVDAEGKAFFPHLPPGPLKILVAKVPHPAALIGLSMGGSGFVTVDAEDPEGTEPAPDAPPPEKVELRPLATGTVKIVSGQHATLDLREAKGARIEGVFVGAGEGATVLLSSGDQQAGDAGTDEEGRFLFEAVAPGKYRVMAAGNAGRVAKADVEVKPLDAVVTVRLEMPLGAIAGRILGADGKPAAEARVLVAPREGPRGQAASLADLMEQLAGVAEADEEGRFRVGGLAPGEYRVLGAVGRRLDVAQVTVRDGEEQVELRVDDARLRRLAVGLRGPGGPVEGTVSLLGPDGGSAEMLALMEEDAIEAPKAAATHEFFLAPGRYRLVAQSAGLAPVLGEAVEVAADREVTLVLGPGVRVELALEGPDGPVANREVDVRNEHGIRLVGQSPLEMLLGGQGLRTDGGGVLALEAVPPGRYALIVDGKEKARVDVGASPVARRIRIE